MYLSLQRLRAQPQRMRQHEIPRHETWQCTHMHSPRLHSFGVDTGTTMAVQYFKPPIPLSVHCRYGRQLVVDDTYSPSFRECCKGSCASVEVNLIDIYASPMRCQTMWLSAYCKRCPRWPAWVQSTRSGVSVLLPVVAPWHCISEVGYGSR